VSGVGGVDVKTFLHFSLMTRRKPAGNWRFARRVHCVTGHT
jgi:hypothetical protein